tara:strand:+ start:607 stop:1725 length:1119 start_codon:yes stop_codon:yes gene_type:complete
MHDNTKIGITVDFNISPFSNGLQQNIIFLQKLLEDLDNIQTDLLFTGNPNKYQWINKSSCKPLEEILKSDAKNYDLIILMGITMNENKINELRRKNPNLKIIFMHCGNQVAHDIENSIYRNNLNRLITPMRGLDAIWTLPHHELNKQYIKNYFKCEKVLEVPYLWENFFIEDQINTQKINREDLIINFKKNKNIVILEPNLTYQKNCLIPIFIVEEFERNNPGEINKCNVMGVKNLDNTDYLLSLIISMDIYKKRKNFIKFQDRVPFVNAVSNYGSIVISHQIQNDLNNLYFDTLYLDLPLIHNSERISEFGYYYENHNISDAALLLEECLKGHYNNLDYYKSNNQKFFLKHSIKNLNNKKAYFKFIENVIR